MITVNKQLLSGTPDDVRARVEYLARDQDHLEYLAGTWLRELAVTLAACDGMTCRRSLTTTRRGSNSR